MEIKAEELLYRLQNKLELPNLKQLLVVYGEEDYYQNQITTLLPEYIFADITAENREITILEKDVEVKDLEVVINTYPFFCGKSLVIIKDEKLLNGKSESDNKGKNLEKLLQLLEDIPDYCTVFINVNKFDKRTKLFKHLKQNGLICECLPLRPYNLAPWLATQAQIHHARFTQDALDLIMEYLASVDKVPLTLLEQEIAKIAVYVNGRNLWTKEDVENIFSDLPEASNFKLLEFLGEKNLPKILQMLSGMRSKGENILPVCGLILFQLRRMLQFMELERQKYDMKNIIAELKIPPFVFKRLQQQTHRFTELKLKQAIIEIAQLNIDLRKGGRDYQRLEEILLCLLK